jgi:dTDP-4-dehydrorhamnose 3,5-epimerase
MLIEPIVFEDSRGHFFEAWNQTIFDECAGRRVTFVQDNHSRSKKGVVRGLHYQNPSPQGKLVRCISGAIWDVAVDLRRSSATFLQWYGTELSAANRRQLWVPEGFAHGFLVLSDGADVLYKATDSYQADHDRVIRFDDPQIGIEWPAAVDPADLSVKDRNAPGLAMESVYP